MRELNWFISIKVRKWRWKDEKPIFSLMNVLSMILIHWFFVYRSVLIINKPQLSENIINFNQYTTIELAKKLDLLKRMKLVAIATKYQGWWFASFSLFHIHLFTFFANFQPIRFQSKAKTWDLRVSGNNFSIQKCINFT